MIVVGTGEVLWEIVLFTTWPAQFEFISCLAVAAASFSHYDKSTCTQKGVYVQILTNQNYESTQFLKFYGNKSLDDDL